MPRPTAGSRPAAAGRRCRRWPASLTRCCCCPKPSDAALNGCGRREAGRRGRREAGHRRRRERGRWRRRRERRWRGRRERRRRRPARKGRIRGGQVERAAARRAQDRVQVLAGHVRALGRRVREALDRGVDVARQAADLAAVVAVLNLVDVARRQLLQLAPQAPERRLDLQPLQGQADDDHRRTRRTPSGIHGN